MTRKVLGKGLDSLIPGVSLDDKGQSVKELKVEDVSANRYQPREEFDSEKMAELIASVKEKGVVQPILVRQRPDGTGEYELIAGERRLRAAREAGLERIPAIVREATDREMLEISLLENIQRQDLNPIEEAEALERLMEEFELTQEELARRLGKERSTVANTLRLQKLPQEIKTEVRKGTLSAGHARTLLSVPDAKEQKQLVMHIKQRRLSVRDTERLVDSLKGKLSAKTRRKSLVIKEVKDPHLRAVESQLCQRLGTQVVIKSRGQGGCLQIAYYSPEDFERLLELMRIN